VTAAVTDDGFDLRTATLSGLDQAFAAGMTIMNAEMVRDFGHLLSTGRLGADIARRLEAGRQISATDIAAAEAVRKTFGVAVDDALADVDALVLPTLPAAAVLLRDAGDAAAALRMTRLVRPFNLTGHPAISLPIPDAAATGPVSLQLVGRRGDDAHLCAIAGRLEANLRSLRHQQGEIRS